ncbi:MAG: ABC transporter ATP-binding protein, partial [Desulfovibrio sp.]|nr:ABC transporter ATP-binding protein [Desulfovibrio sp.]
MDTRIDERPADAVAVCGLCKRDGPEKVLDDISFAVPRGRFTVLLGPAGAGKTTILRLLAGLETASAGTIFMDGIDIAGVEPKDRDIAMIFDNLALYPHKTGFQNIASPLVSRKISRDEITRRVEEIAVKLHILQILERFPKTMSGGERQRIALGRALVRSPRIFLLDEPLSSLDAPLRFELRSVLKRLQREQGHSFLMATPDFNEALAVADSVIMLRAGKVVCTAPPQEIYDHPADVQAALFVGSPQINILPAEHSDGVIRCLGIPLPVPPPLAAALNGPAGTPVRVFRLGIRPENIELRRTPPPPPPRGGGGPGGGRGTRGGGNTRPRARGPP